MSSSDGFCSCLSFAPGELGQIYTGHIPTAHHPMTVNTTGVSTAQPTPTATPTAVNAPPLVKQSFSAIPPSPSPVAVLRPTSPTRSSSASSVATLSSHVQTPVTVITSNPTPTLGTVPSVAATNSATVGLPLTTPPQTPMSGNISTTSSVSGSVLGKRDASAASESEKEDAKEVTKKRRIAPTLVGAEGSSGK